MTDIFLKFVNMSIAASWLVLAVVVFRLIFRKAPKWLNPVLWSIVGLRLIMPFSIESALSLIPSPEPISPEIMYTQQPEIHSGIPVVNHLVNPIISETFAPTPGASVNPLQILMMIAAGVWVIGIVLLLLYTAISYLRLHSQMKTAVPLKDNIYQSENVSSPFVMGLLRPRIYLPFQMAEQDMAYVIAHEQTHIQRCDHWMKPLGFLLLSFYWFNPLLWIAYILLCRDIELACDERVIKELGLEQRADYSQALLNCSVPHKRIAVCPLAFGEVGVKERVKNVLNYRKPAFWMVIAALCFCVLVAVCFLTNPTTRKLDDIIWENGYIITKQKDYNFTLSIPKEKLTESIYTPEGQKFKENEVIVYQTDTTKVYLKYVMPSDMDENMLFFVFDFSYELPKAGKIVIPHYKAADDLSADNPDLNHRANTYISLRNGTLYTPTQRYVNAVKKHLWGPEEQFGFRVSTEACRSAEGIMMIDVSSYEWTYYSDNDAETADFGESGYRITAGN